MTLKSIAVAVLRGYKRWISPLLPPACRFHPTCSEYASEAIEIYGAWRGTGMALRRLLRCHPFSKGGFDPVPAVPHAHCTRTGRPVNGGR